MERVEPKADLIKQLLTATMKAYNCGKKGDYPGQEEYLNPITRCNLNGADASFMFVSAITVSIIIALAWLEQKRRY